MEALVHRLLTAYGVRVDTVTEPRPVGGWQQARLDRVAALLAEHPGAYCPNQYDNPDNVDAYAGLADELIEQLGHVDALVCSVGTGGHSAGVTRAPRRHHPRFSLVGVDAIGSTIFGQPSRPRVMRGLGSSIHPRNVAHEEFDEIHWVAPHEAVWACRTLAATHCMIGGWSVGAVTVVASWPARTMPADTRIAAIFPDGPARHYTTVYDDTYCAEHGLMGRPPAAEPDGEALMWRRFRSFDRPVRLLMVNQLTINVAFYMLMPYLAGHLSDGLGMTAWTVGLVLGVRNLSQQGLFLLGGTLADRLGHHPVIITGCLLRTLGFALLGFASSLPVLLTASALTGFAGALFNPAVRAYIAHNAGERRVEAFSLFNVFYQAGILLGPLLGLALIAADFRLVCTVAAGLFAALTILQLLALPPCPVAAKSETGVLGDRRTVLTNRPFVLFAGAMTGSYVMSFQVYLALPLAIGSPGMVGALFVVSGAVTILGQLRITDWARRRWPPAQAMTSGLALMGTSFLPVALTTSAAPPHRISAALAYPFEMDIVVALSAGRLVATHYGLCNSIAGVGITAGNLVIGALLQESGRVAPWAALACLGMASAVSIRLMERGGLTRPATSAPA